MNNNLIELQNIISNNKDYTFDFDNNVVTFRSHSVKILFIAIAVCSIILEFELLFIVELGLLINIFANLIIISCLVALYLRTKDFIEIDFKNRTITKRDLMKFYVVKFDDIKDLVVTKFRARSGIYQIEVQTQDQTMGIFFNTNESVCIEMTDWLKRNYFKKN